MLEALIAKVLGWIPPPWSGVRVGHDANARLCTFSHGPFIRLAGDRSPLPARPLHIDVWLELWNRTEHRTTVREVNGTAAGQLLVPDFREMTLEPGGKPIEQFVTFDAPKDAELQAGPGDTIKVDLLLTRGRTRKLRLPIEAKGGS